MGNLILRSCSFRYKKNENNILNNIDIEIPSKSITAIVGMNGTGKSTFLKCVAGILEWNKGSCTFDEKNTKDLWTIIGYVPQIKSIPFNYTVKEFILFGKKNKKNALTNKKIEEKTNDINQLLYELELENISDKYCDEISGGQMQMAYLGYALISKPKILLLDEPELNLDLYRQQQLNKNLKMISNRGTTIIINSHFIENILNVADNCLMLKKNNYQYGSIDEVINEKNIKEYLKIDSVIKNIELKPNVNKKIFIPL